MHYEGYCRGGPWDGKQMSHMYNKFGMMVVPKLEQAMSEDPYTPVVTVYGEYQHVAGQWIWHPNDMPCL